MHQGGFRGNLMIFIRICWVLALLLGAVPALAAPPLDFDALDDGTVLDTAYPGMVFSNTIILSSGVSLNELEFPPRSGSNVASDDGGPIVITFLSPVQSFSAYFTYMEPLQLTAFDAESVQVAQASSLFANNLLESGAAGSSPNEFIVLAAASGIASVQIAGASEGASFTMDDLSVSAVPEPGMLALLACGALVVGGAARRRRRTR